MQSASSGPSPIPKAEGENEVAGLYQQFGVPAAQNIAYAEVYVDSYWDEPIGVSGRNSPHGTVPTPTVRLFDTFDTPPGQYRGFDAEIKLLEAIAIEIQSDARKGECYTGPNGTIRLYSHFTICPSCDGVIAAFRAMFPNVILLVFDGT